MAPLNFSSLELLLELETDGAPLVMLIYLSFFFLFLSLSFFLFLSFFLAPLWWLWGAQAPKATPRYAPAFQCTRVHRLLKKNHPFYMFSCMSIISTFVYECPPPGPTGMKIIMVHFVWVCFCILWLARTQYPQLDLHDWRCHYTGRYLESVAVYTIYWRWKYWCRLLCKHSLFVNSEVSNNGWWHTKILRLKITYFDDALLKGFGIKHFTV